MRIAGFALPVTVTNVRHLRRHRHWRVPGRLAVGAGHRRGGAGCGRLVGWRHGRGGLLATATVALMGSPLSVDSQEGLLSHGRLRAAMSSIPVPRSYEHTADIAGG